MDTFSQELTKLAIIAQKTFIFIYLFNVFKNIILNPMYKVFTLKKTISRVPVSTPSFLVPWLYISTSFYKTMMFLKKSLYSPQTKINYLESFLKFFLIVYISGDILLSSKRLLFTMRLTIYCDITREFQRATSKAEKVL